MGVFRAPAGAVSKAHAASRAPFGDPTVLYFADSPTRTINPCELLEPEVILGKHRIFTQSFDRAFTNRAMLDGAGCMCSTHSGESVVRTLKAPSCACFAGSYRAGVQRLSESEYRP